MNQDQLTEIYNIAYHHYIETLLQNVHSSNKDCVKPIIDITSFNNMINTDPYSEETQIAANLYKNIINKFHTEILEKIKNGQICDPQDESCICIRNQINKCMTEAYNNLDYDDLAPDYKLWRPSLSKKYEDSLLIYQRFLDYERKFNKLYGFDN